MGVNAYVSNYITWQVFMGILLGLQQSHMLRFIICFYSFVIKINQGIILVNVLGFLSCYKKNRLYKL